VEVLEFKDCLSKTVSLSIMTSLYVVRKSAYEGIGGFRKSNSQTWWGDITDFVMKLATHSPFLMVRSPQTTAYRIHEDNSTKSLRAHADGLLGVARSEREGVYPGGPGRRWERYALIGGISAQWAIAYCWRGGERKAALKLLFGAAPMVAAAVWKRFWRQFQEPTPVIFLPEEEPVANASRGGAMPVDVEERGVGTRY
jgi:hypothetical protein